MKDDLNVDEANVEGKLAYDQINDEFEFYSSCAGPASDAHNEDSCTDADSGYSTARNSAIPKERSSNQARKTTKVERCIRSDVKIRQSRILLRLENRSSQQINLQTVAWHLLDFVSPKLDPDYTFPRLPCMFQIVNDQVHFHRQYQTSTGYIQGISPMFLCMAQSLMITYENWMILSDFADTQRRSTDKPAFIICWLEIYDEYVYDFLQQITKLKSSCRSPVEAVCSVRPLCEVANFLTSIIKPVKAARTWKFENIELAWSLLLTAISEEALLSNEMKKLAIKFQKSAFCVFLGAMDMLYYFGEIPSGITSDFIIYRDQSRTHSFDFHPPSSCSVLWSRGLIKTIHRGAILRQRLGILFNSKSLSFSEAFTALLPQWEADLVGIHVFRRVFYTTAENFTERLGQELFRKVIDAGLLQLWTDMKNITVGAVSTMFAGAIFNLEISVSPEKAFYCSLRRGNVSSVAKWKRELAPGHTGVLKCEVSGILSHLVENSLIRTINTILDSWLRLYRMHFILVAVIADKNILCSNLASLQRQFRFFLSRLYSVLIIIRNDFHSRVHLIFTKTEEKIKTLTSYYECENLLRDAEKEFLKLVDVKQDITTKNLIEVICTFAEIIDDIRLNSLSNNIDRSQMIRWRKKLFFCHESIRSLGKSVSSNNTFFSLYKQIQYR